MTPMSGQIIPRERWVTFFDDLSRAYRGNAATLEIVAPATGPVVVAFDEPFDGISAGDPGCATVVIQLGGSFDHTIASPLRVRSVRNATGAGRIVEVEAVETPLTRLYLAEEGHQSTGRGEIFGGAERSVDQSFDSSMSAPGPGQSREVGGDPTAVGGSAGAAGGSVAGPAGAAGGGGVGERDGGVSFGSSDDMGGVATVGGGSLGDQDLSGRRSYDITAAVYDDFVPSRAAFDEEGETSVSAGGGGTGHGEADVRGAGATGSTSRGEADVIDAGAGQGVIDRGIDPIEGAPIDPANDATDSYVQGDVGAQAERDLDQLPRQRRVPKKKRSR